jgi:chromosome segregation ATPase
MPVSERERLALYRQLQEQLGNEGADTLMELLPPAGWNDIATRADVQATATLLRGEMAQLGAELRSEMAQLGAELRGEMSELRSELRGEMAELRGEMAELRTELRGEMVELRSEVRQDLAGTQRTLVLWMAAFAASTWVALLTGVLAG